MSPVEEYRIQLKWLTWCSLAKHLSSGKATQADINWADICEQLEEVGWLDVPCVGKCLSDYWKEVGKGQDLFKIADCLPDLLMREANQELKSGKGSVDWKATLRKFRSLSPVSVGRADITSLDAFKRGELHLDDKSIAERWWKTEQILSPIKDLLRDKTYPKNAIAHEVKEISKILDQIPELLKATRTEQKLTWFRPDGLILGYCYLNKIYDFLVDTRESLKKLHLPDASSENPLLSGFKKLWEASRNDRWVPIVICECKSKYSNNCDLINVSFTLNWNVEDLARARIAYSLVSAFIEIDCEKVIRSLLASDEKVNRLLNVITGPKEIKKIAKELSHFESIKKLILEIDKGTIPPKTACECMSDIWYYASVGVKSDDAKKMKKVVCLLNNWLDGKEKAPKVKFTKDGSPIGKKKFSLNLEEGRERIDFIEGVVTTGIGHLRHEPYAASLEVILNSELSENTIKEESDFQNHLRNLMDAAIASESITKSKDNFSSWLRSADGEEWLDSHMKRFPQGNEFSQALLSFTDQKIYPSFEGSWPEDVELGKGLTFKASPEEKRGKVLSSAKYSVNPGKAIAVIGLGKESRETGLIEKMETIDDPFIRELRDEMVRKLIYSEKFEIKASAQRVVHHLSQLCSTGSTQFRDRFGLLKEWCDCDGLQLTPREWSFDGLPDGFKFDSQQGICEYIFSDSDERKMTLKKFGFCCDSTKSGESQIYEPYCVELSVRRKPSGFQELIQHIEENACCKKIKLNELPQNEHQGDIENSIITYYTEFFDSHNGNLPDEIRKSLEGLLDSYDYYLDDDDVQLERDGEIYIQDESNLGDLRLVKPALRRKDGRIIQKAKGIRQP
jgi:hypothetical protein